MATKARQQYFADEISLQKQRREFSLEDNIKQKIDSVEEGAQVNRIETVKVNGTALTPDANKAVNVEVPDVIDNLYTVAADDALSAKQGKILYDYIQNLQTIGRFLSNWDTATGLPITNPSESPYQYKAGDYYRVSNVAVSPATNYKPDGSSYTIGVASTTVESLFVAVSDLYLYDGTDWILLSNSGSSIAVDSSLSTTSTNPVENRVITNALNGKHPGAISNVAPSNPVEGMLWYDTTTHTMKVWDGTAWQSVGGGDVLVSDQANNIFTPGMKIWGGTETDYQSLTPDSNTAYLLLANQPTPPSPWQPGVDTLVYFPFDTDMLDHSGNSVAMITDGTINISNSAPNIGTALYINYGSMDSSSTLSTSGSLTISGWIYQTQAPLYDNAQVFGFGIDQNAGSPSGCNFIYANSNGPADVSDKPGLAFFNYDPVRGSSAYNINNNTWYHICAVYDSGTGKTSMYINGQYYTEYTSGRSNSSLYRCISRSRDLNRSFYGYMSELIGENKARTAQEIQDYFDQTKANYGIS